MDTTEDFFSRNHLRLLNIASWAKIFAWIALAAYTVIVIVQIIQLLFAKDSENIFGPASQSLLTLLAEDPVELFRRLVSMALTLIRGIVYFLILKGVSLGLNMIVETDINYRENRKLQHE